MVSHTTPGFRSSYFEGMFSHEKREPHPFDSFYEQEATKYHEAGHVVVGYALGNGLSRIELYEDIKIDGDRKLSAYGGAVYERSNLTGEINSLIRRGILNERVVAYAVDVAAGPAAERKFRIKSGMCQRLLGPSEGDHQKISVIRKGLCYRLEPCFDIEGEAWRRAQDALELDVIWNAIEALAGWLEMPDHGDEPGHHVEVLPGPTARAILRRAGIRPGMLDGMWPSIGPNAFCLCSEPKAA